MLNNSQNTTNSSIVSSEIWGEVSVRINSDYSNFKELQTSGLFRLVIASRYGRKVILKTLKDDVKDSLKHKELLRKEFEILMMLHNDYVVNVITWEENIVGYGSCIVMDYLDGITLDEYLKQPHTKKEKLHILSETVKAVEYIHSKQIIHRDLKPTNIIVLADGNHIKLIDFGLADSEAYEVLKQPCGTEGYVAPEQRDGINDLRNDIYSLGCIIRKMELGWAYRSIVSSCIAPLEQRPSSAKELHTKIESVEKRNTFISRLAVVLCFLIIGVGCWYVLRDKQQIEQIVSEQSVTNDMVNKENVHTPSTTISSVPTAGTKTADNAVDGNSPKTEKTSSVDGNMKADEAKSTVDASKIDLKGVTLDKIEPSKMEMPKMEAPKVELPKAEITVAKTSSSGYEPILAEMKKIIDKDIKPMNAFMDTVSDKRYLNPRLQNFYVSEADKLNKLAEAQRDKIAPSKYMEFYYAMMDYYSNQMKWWRKKSTELYHKN